MDPVTKAEWQGKVLEAAGPVVVDFYTGGCGPCRKMAPVLDGLSAGYEGAVTFLKADCNDGDNIELAADYSIATVPTFILFKDGKEVDRTGGVMGEADFKAWVEKHR